MNTLGHMRELREAGLGWKTVLAGRKDVPDQNASSAEPLRAHATIGRATEREVPSRATVSVRVRIARATKAR